MKRYWQAILFFTFTLAFLVSAPLVVLYTAGYRYQLTGNRIVKTGVLSVSTVPRGATLSIDDVPETTHTPVVVDNLLPGKHAISLEKEGYARWEKVLDIYSQSTTFAENVVLFYEDPFTFISEAPEPVIPPVVTETTFNGRQVRISTLPDRSVLSFVDAADISTIIAYLPTGTYTFESAPSDVLLLADRERERFVIVNPADEQPVLLSVTGKEFAWQDGRSRLLFSDGFDVQMYDVPSHVRETLVRLSQPIIDLAWYPKSDVIVYATTTSVTALELDRRGVQNHIDLGHLERIDQLSIEPQGDLMQVTGTNEGREGVFQRRLQK